VADIHEFDEAQDIALLAEKARHRQDARIIQAALDHHIHLDGTQAHPGSLLHPFQHARDREVYIVHSLKDFIIQGVEADGDPLQAGSLQGPRQPGEQRPIRRQGEIEVGDLGEHAHEQRQVAANERLPARQPDLAHPMADEDPCQSRDFFEGQDLIALQKLIARSKDLFGHAIHTPKITTVRDGNPQVAQGSLQGICKGHRCTHLKRTTAV
jgi:hypothetical protein